MAFHRRFSTSAKGVERGGRYVSDVALNEIALNEVALSEIALSEVTRRPGSSVSAPVSENEPANEGLTQGPN